MSLPRNPDILAQQLQDLQQENVALRSQLLASNDGERSAVKVVTAHLDKWVDSVTRATAVAVGAPSASHAADQATSAALHDALAKLRDLTGRMALREVNVVIPLRNTCASLESENEQLKHQIIILQASESTRDAQNSLELSQAKELIASYKNQLSCIQRQAAEQLGPASSTILEAVAIKQRAVELSSTNAALISRCAALERQLSSAQSLQKATEENHKEQLRVLEENSSAQLAQKSQQLLSHKSKEEELILQISALEQDRESARESTELAIRNSASSAGQAPRERQLSELASLDPSSLRSQMVSFWFAGREEIDALKERVLELEGFQKQLSVSKDEIVGMKRSRSSFVESLAALSAEVERLRAESQHAKANCIGVEAENASLTKHLASLLSGNMSHVQIASCMAVIRKEAADAASTVRHDPAAVQRDNTRAQEIKNDIIHLSREKDRLLKIIRGREERIFALNAQLVSGQCPQVLLNHCDALEHLVNCTLYSEAAEDHQIEVGQRQRRMVLYKDLIANRDEAQHQRTRAAELSATCASYAAQLEALGQAYKSDIATRAALQEEMLAKISLLVEANEKLKSENIQVRSSHQTSNTLMVRLHEHHLALYQVVASQTQLVATLHEKIEALNSELRSLMVSHDLSADSVDTIAAKISTQLEDHLALLRDTIEGEHIRQATSDVSVMSALSEKIKNGDEKLQKSEALYKANIAETSARINNVIAEVRQQWEANDKACRAALEKEKGLMQIRSHTEDAIVRLVVGQTAPSQPLHLAATAAPTLRSFPTPVPSPVLSTIAQTKWGVSRQPVAEVAFPSEVQAEVAAVAVEVVEESVGVEDADVDEAADEEGVEDEEAPAAAEDVAGVEEGETPVQLETA